MVRLEELACSKKRIFALSMFLQEVLRWKYCTLAYNICSTKDRQTLGCIPLAHDLPLSLLSGLRYQLRFKNTPLIPLD